MKVSHFIIALFTMALLSCKKQPVDQLSLLPVATQTGANTFGCLVNGKAFLPKTSGFLAGPKLVCQYEGSNISRYYGLFLVASYKNNNGSNIGITIGTDSLSLVEGQTYNLKTRLPGNAYANCAFFGGRGTNYMTNDTISGVLTVTKLDISSDIISGTFNFKAVDTIINKTIEITAGRFDLHFN
jgi:hypothetical protein